MVYPNHREKHLENALIIPKSHVSWKRYLGKDLKNPPKKYIFVYYPYVLDYFKRKYKPKRIRLYRLLTLYQYKDLAVVHIKGVGAPHATIVLEELIALGGRKFINIGSAGGLKDFGVYVCEKAIRDEGTSHHYLPPSKYSYPDKKLTSSLEKSILKNNLDYEGGTSWTIDAPYRETIAEIKRYKKQGVKTVEMEAAALFAVSQTRKVKIASAFVVSDLVLEDKWDPQFDSKHVKQKLKKLLDATVDCLLE